MCPIQLHFLMKIMYYFAFQRPINEIAPPPKKTYAANLRSALLDYWYGLLFLIEKILRPTLGIVWIQGLNFKPCHVKENFSI